jgi:hypothetical protein
MMMKNDRVEYNAIVGSVEKQILYQLELEDTHVLSLEQRSNTSNTHISFFLLSIIR